MSTIVEAVVGNTALALVGALALLLAGRPLRRRPAVAASLWGLLLLQLCWPWQWRWSVPVLPATGAAAPVAVAPVGAEVLPPFRARLEGTASPIPAPIRLPVPLSAPRLQSVAADWHWDLGRIWLVAAGVVGAGLLTLILRTGRRLAAGVPAPPWLAAELAALSARLSMPVPRYVDDPRARLPFVWAFGRPRLVGSATALAALPQRVRTAVLAHELAHLRRGDHHWLRLETALAALWFWHPLFWFLRARAREQAELACDAWALWAVPEARLGYARALVAALETEDPVSAVPVLAARPGARRQFERRLSMILQNPVPCRLSRRSVPLLCGFGLLLAVAPVAAQGGGEHAADKPKVEIRVDGVKLEEISPRQRERLLRELGLEGEALRLALRARSVGGDAAPAADERETRPEPRRPSVALKARRDDADRRGGEMKFDFDFALGSVFDEVRAELRQDDDLRELGLTDEVEGLLDTVQHGGDFGGALERVIDQALVGAGKLAAREIEADEDLRGLGIAGDLSHLVTGLLQNDDVRQGLTGMARKAMRSALQEARTEIAADGDLKELGLTDGVLELLDGIEDGKLDLRGLQPLIEQAVRGATGAARAAIRDAGDGEAEPAPEPRRQRRAGRGR